jgi:hypothetical protein
MIDQRTGNLDFWNKLTADYDPRKHARRDDPSTSHAAAHSIVETATVVQRRVLEIHHGFDKGLTDEELTEIYKARYGPCGQSSIRSRRNDLALKNLLVDSGEKRELHTGRMGIVWKLA